MTSNDVSFNIISEGIDPDNIIISGIGNNSVDQINKDILNILNQIVDVTLYKMSSNFVNTSVLSYTYRDVGGHLKYINIVGNHQTFKNLLYIQHTMNLPDLDDLLIDARLSHRRDITLGRLLGD